MQISYGLITGQVLQRNSADTGSAQVSGRCETDGRVECRALKGARVLARHDWQPCGEAATGLFHAQLSDLPIGGPFRIEFRITGKRSPETVVIDEIFVGDVWIMAGQSNMEGIGNLVDAPKPHPMVRAFYMRDEWGQAREKMHFLAEAVDVVHNGYGNGTDRLTAAALEEQRASLLKGVSPGLAFGLEMAKRSGVPQGLIACAHGGTSMEQWSPALRNQSGASFYGAMMRRLEKLGQPVAGVLWYQGESDANTTAAPLYTERMIDLVAALRRDTHLPTLPWLIVQIGCHASSETPAAWNNIQEQQRLLPTLIPHLDVAPAVDLDLDDGIHISGRSQIILGKRLARLAARMVHKAPGVKPGLRLKTVALVPTPYRDAGSGSMSVELTYGNTAGRLISQGHPTGFSLLDSRGRDVCCIYKTTLKGACVTLHTSLARPQLETLTVSYGHGRFPVCNITDSEGMGLPVMSSIPVDLDHPLHCATWETVRLGDRQSIKSIGLATIGRASGWHPAPPRNGFGVLPKLADSEVTGIFALRTRLGATETLTASMTFGANAPFKLWVNGELVLHDLECKTPLNPDQYKVELSLRKGSNDLVVCFAPPGVAAFYGISARIGTPDDKQDPRITLI
ncbi:MAG TPA: hypothetical protein DCS43_08170 [Verrucomicrobia bacterium]|nr:hypothetical protein [Verrucomicrobiota bacterium]